MNAYEKMRCALRYVKQWSEDCISEEGADNVDDMIAVVDDALAAPPRNCDVGTVEERVKRYHEFCRGRVCETCPAMTAEKDDLEDGSCIIQWEDMPYEEGGKKCPEAIAR